MLKEINNKEVETIEKLKQKMWEKFKWKNKSLLKTFPLPGIKW